MKKSLFTIAIISFSLTCFAVDPPRKPMQKGSFSIGAQPVFSMSSNKSDPGNNVTSFSKIGLGVPIRYFPAKNLGFEANIGIVFNGEESDFATGKTKTSANGVDVGIGIFKPVFLFAFVKGGSFVLTPQVRADFFSGKTNTKTPNTSFKNDVKGIQVGAFLGAEWFPSNLGVPQLSLQAAIGLVGFTSFDVSGNKDQNTWAFDPINPQPGSLNMLNATFGFHYYFF
jgi:hypothetical protein